MTATHGTETGEGMVGERFGVVARRLRESQAIGGSLPRRRPVESASATFGAAAHRLRASAAVPVIVVEAGGPTGDSGGDQPSAPVEPVSPTDSRRLRREWRRG